MIMTDAPGQPLLLRNGRLLDPVTGTYAEGDLLAVDGRIAETGPGVTAPAGAEVRDLRGGFVLPGLIDAHVHVTAITADLASLGATSPFYLGAHAARIMGGMLDRGFTAVRDVAGADYGIAAAQADGAIRGPRVFFGGRALSQTGGHGDDRGPGADPLPAWSGSRIADSMDALRAVVDEAGAANRYVCAHAYTARAVNRALEAGIRSIEHGNLIDASSVSLLVERDAFLVPTLVTYWALKKEGRQFGLPEGSWRKVDEVLDAGLSSLDLAYRGGVRLAYGTDLLGGMHRHQSEEFRIRAQVQPPIDIVRAATCAAAELLRAEGQLGTLAAGAHADVIVLDGDPLQDIGLLADPAAHMPLVIQAGAVVRQR